MLFHIPSDNVKKKKDKHSLRLSHNVFSFLSSIVIKMFNENNSVYFTYCICINIDAYIQEEQKKLINCLFL